jgi:hypothetical protein
LCEEEKRPRDIAIKFYVMLFASADHVQKEARMKRTNLGLLALTWLLLLLQGVTSAQEMCGIADQEEYAVFATVLFPNPPEVPAPKINNEEERLRYLAEVESHTIHLDGFHGNSYTIQDETSEQSNQWKGDDRDMADDFNRKRAHACRMDKEKFLSFVPEGKLINFISRDEIGKSGGWQEYRKSYPMSGGVTYLSRPGFDAGRNKAVLEVRHQADYEMGVGYRVYLKKSSKTGKWLIIGAVETMRS